MNISALSFFTFGFEDVFKNAKVMKENETLKKELQKKELIIKQQQKEISRLKKLETQLQNEMDEAMTDEVTQLPNRQFLIKTVGDYKNDPRYLKIVVDKNRLKVLNDLYGHSAGDKGLKIVSEVIRKNTREEDLKIRLGGDEFLILVKRNVKKLNMLNMAIAQTEKTLREQHPQHHEIFIDMELPSKIYGKNKENLENAKIELKKFLQEEAEKMKEICKRIANETSNVSLDVVNIKTKQKEKFQLSVCCGWGFTFDEADSALYRYKTIYKEICQQNKVLTSDDFRKEYA